MKRFSILTVVAIALLISACGAPAAPTMQAIDVQNTAVAAAFTMVAETQAAIPTATPLPPTEPPTQTPLPTNTPLPLPTSATLAVISSPTTASVSSSNNSTSTDPCATRVLSAPEGKETTIRIVNTTKLGVTVSLYLNETASKGACGYRSFTIAKNNDIVFKDLVQGCYSLWAWSDNAKGKFTSSGYGCINNPDKWTFEVRESNIKFIGP
jgi:Predicted solute binding protein